MKWLQNLTGGYSSSAKVVGDTLVLSLPDASSPVVWRMELGKIKAAAFEVEDSGEKGFQLIMKTPEGDTQKIAPFSDKATAIKALMAASNAMEHAQSAANDSAPVAAAAVPTPQKKKGQLMTGIIGVLILVAILFALTKMGPNVSPAYNTSTSGSLAQGGGPGSAGVPVSADDFLKSR